MANYDLAIIEKGYTPSVNLDQYYSVRAWREAIAVLGQQYYYNFNVDATIVDENHFSQQEWYQRLNITRYPTILIADKQTGILLARIGPTQISAARIVQVFNTVQDVVFDQATGTFVYPDGSPLGENGLLDTENDSGSGGGLFPASWGAAGIGGSLLPLIALAAGAVQAYQSKGTERYLWGALSAWGGVNFLNSSSSSLGSIKSTDSTPIRPGSRVEMYWSGRLDTRLPWFGSRKTYFESQGIQPDVLEVTNRFGLHSLEFGNWVTQQERYSALVSIAQSLYDLSTVLGVPQKKIGLNKTLAIAFGARGRGGDAKASYFPGYRVINLTKKNGANSLAHEYGHALDHLAAQKLKTEYLASRVSHMPEGMIGTYFSWTIDHLLYDEKGESNFSQRLSLGSDYAKSRHEIWARTFETWVESELSKKKIKNLFLAKSKSSYTARVYPTPWEVQKVSGYIRKAVKDVFSSLK